MKLVFFNDFLFHSFEYKPAYHKWIADILNPALELACGKNISFLYDLKDSCGHTFSREKLKNYEGQFTIFSAVKK